MDDKPIDKSDILKELEDFHNLDSDYADGRILGSMCTEAHPFAKEVYCKFLDTNLGDPGLFKGTKQIEDKVIKSIGELLSIDNTFVFSSMVSCSPHCHKISFSTSSYNMTIRIVNR